MRKIFLFGLVLAFCCINLSAQEAVTVAGGDAAGTNGSMSYSIGQVLYTTDTGNGGFVVYGVQQPREISILSHIEGVIRLKHQVNIFPIPANDIINMKIEAVDYSKISYQLIDLNGKMLYNDTVDSNLAQINAQKLAKGLYFIRINFGDKYMETYRIIKN